jgi:hypothetical protein
MSSAPRNADKPQAQRKHPEEYEPDLEPNHAEGQNIGQMPPLSNAAEYRTSHPLTEADYKRMGVRQLSSFTEDELRQIPIVPAGERLEQGGTYLNLKGAELAPFSGTADMEVGEDQWVVPKRYTPYTLWNRLLGETDPQRTT